MAATPYKLKMSTLQITTLKTLVRSTLLAASSALLTACSTVDFGMESRVNNAPQLLRHKQTSQKTYYIESLGSGFSKRSMLANFFEVRAKELCVSGVKNTEMHNGNRYPDGKLPDVRMNSCFEGSFCQADYAGFPLVYGTVNCN